jgi:hypothetical protein
VRARDMAGRGLTYANGIENENDLAIAQIGRTGHTVDLDQGVGDWPNDDFALRVNAIDGKPHGG